MEKYNLDMLNLIRKKYEKINGIYKCGYDCNNGPKTDLCKHCKNNIICDLCEKNHAIGWFGWLGFYFCDECEKENECDDCGYIFEESRYWILPNGNKSDKKRKCNLPCY